MSRRLVVEADGGSRGNPGPAAYGAVVRDADTGEVLAERAESIGVATNNVAEYRGLIAGLEAAREIDPSASLDVRLDSKLVVEQMSGRWKIKHPDIRPLALEANRLAPAGRVAYTWVPRARNAHADRLLNEALDEASGDPAHPSPAGSRSRPTAAVPPPAGTADPTVQAAPPVTAAVVAARADLGPPTTLLLLRHGETEHTLDRRYSGSGGADPGLTPAGVEQAVRAAEVLARRGDVDAVVTSPLRRTRETAEIVARRLGLPLRVDAGWAEASFGEWDGHTFEEVRARWPAELDAWLASPEVTPPGGESLVDVDRRVAVARDRTLARFPGRTVLVVSHVTPIKMLVRHVLQAPYTALYRLELAPASCTEIAHWTDGTSAVRGLNLVP